MKKIIFLIALLSSNIAIYAQTKKINSICISVPVIWNKSSGVYYQLGNRKEPEGKGRSAGIGINYSRSIYKNVFGIIGFGYFKQNFSISRPFDFNSPTNLLFRTQNYSYSNIEFEFALGGLITLNKKFNLIPKIGYSKLYSIKQRYIVNKEYGTKQNNNYKFSLGDMYKSSLELNYFISKQFRMGIGIVVPFNINWNDDKIFFEYDYSNDTQKIAYNKSSIGGILTINYNIK